MNGIFQALEKVMPGHRVDQDFWERMKSFGHIGKDQIDIQSTGVKVVNKRWTGRIMIDT
jgi:hypothetical protein